MTNLRDQLITVADAYCLARQLSRSRVSTIVFNAGMTLDRIASGRDLATGSFERAMRWFSQNWPEEAKWPKNIERPRTSPASPEAA
jgi:hypothetical protein